MAATARSNARASMSIAWSGTLWWQSGFRFTSWSTGGRVSQERRLYEPRSDPLVDNRRWPAGLDDQLRRRMVNGVVGLYLALDARDDGRECGCAGIDGCGGPGCV